MKSGPKVAWALGGLLAIGAGVWLLVGHREEAKPEPPAAESVPTKVETTKAEPPPPRRGEIHDDAVLGEGPVDKNEARPEPGDGEAPLAHALRSVIEANQEELKLQPEEVGRLTAHYLEFQEVHSEVVRRFMEEKSFDPGTVQLRVPPFPVEGKALRELFYERMKASVPPEKFDAVVAQLGQYFESTFHGFGAAEQTIVLKRDPEQPETFEVQWEAKLPEDRAVATGIEGVNFAGGSTHEKLSREQIETGEYRFLGPVLEARFPRR